MNTLSRKLDYQLSISSLLKNVMGFTGANDLNLFTLELRNYSLVAFDLDGVLVDSEGVVETAIKSWATKHNIDPEMAFEKSAARRDYDLSQEIAPWLDPQVSESEIAELEILNMNKLKEIDGARQFYLSIPSSNRCIVTSSARSSAIARLENIKIPVPEHMITAESVKNGKPHPEAYQTACKIFGVDTKNCIVFEDSDTGYKSAISAGCDCIMIGTGSSVYRQALFQAEEFQQIVLKH